MNIIVLAGGYSPEREVSLTSGSLIANALMENGHRVCLLDVYVGLKELPKDPDSLFKSSGRYSHSVSEEIPDLEKLKKETGNGDALIGRNVIELCRMADIVFLALHGAMGENGQLQATLDSYAIPYTGSGYVGSLLAMDKDIAKRLLRASGVRTPDWVAVDPHCANVERILQEIPLPAVVKPSACGSSVGVSMADTKEELEEALREASRWDNCVLVEKRIVGRELTVGIIDGETLPAVEIIPNEGFYDYKNKYKGNTLEVCPAEISPDTALKASEMTRVGFDALRLYGYARFDYLLDRDGLLWCLEANTLPGMTPTSLLPQAAAAIGMSYGQLCEKLIEVSLKNRKAN